MTLTENTTNSRKGAIPDRVLLPVRKEVHVRKYLPLEIRVRLRSRVLELAKLSMSYQQIHTEILESTHIRLSKGSISEWPRGIHNTWDGKNRCHAAAPPELADCNGVLDDDW